ncbi:hypothetical protein BV25DRAFT_1919581 [Artomyces pyxidatus]|uniref:Uncharacterized protein n=1 Tax=Artomyces pyxidatus TaxID=48021 RepID=A0ACB8SNZ8_9AGAM|nr:hypothetical protein BV25DRAFT_1919581 [Artomyces pyxidatus]
MPGLHEPRGYRRGEHIGWTLEMLDEDIDAVSDILLLKTRRNTLASPVTMLPVEILRRIFSLTTSVYEPSPLYIGMALGWIKVTHVCQRWRRVALNDWTLCNDLD